MVSWGLEIDGLSCGAYGAACNVFWKALHLIDKSGQNFITLALQKTWIFSRMIGMKKKKWVDWIFNFFTDPRNNFFIQLVGDSLVLISYLKCENYTKQFDRNLFLKISFWKRKIPIFQFHQTWKLSTLKKHVLRNHQFTIFYFLVWS